MPENNGIISCKCQEQKIVNLLKSEGNRKSYSAIQRPREFGLHMYASKSKGCQRMHFGKKKSTATNMRHTRNSHFLIATAMWQNALKQRSLNQSSLRPSSCAQYQGDSWSACDHPRDRSQTQGTPFTLSVQELRASSASSLNAKNVHEPGVLFSHERKLM